MRRIDLLENCFTLLSLLVDFRHGRHHLDPTLIKPGGDWFGCRLR